MQKKKDSKKELQEEKQKSRPLSGLLKEMKEYKKKRYGGVFGKFLSWWDGIWFGIKHFNIFKEIKYFIQRGIRGWSDRDAWGAYNHISAIISEMAEYLAKPATKGCTSSYPGSLKSWKEWQRILKKISRAYRLINEKECYSPIIWKEHPSLARWCGMQTHDEFKKIQEGKKLLEKWFYFLWD